MPVNSTHPLYDEVINEVTFVRSIISDTCRDCIVGLEPEIRGSINYSEILLRNARYRNDGVLTNFTESTRDWLVGAVFRKAPHIVLPDVIDYIKWDATGDGQTLEAYTKDLLVEMLEGARVFSLAEYPELDTNKERYKVEDLDPNAPKAFLRKYVTESGINWETVVINGHEVLKMIVFQEQILEKDPKDEFIQRYAVQYRVFRLDVEKGEYTQQVYDKNLEPIDKPKVIAKGRLSRIPITTFGSVRNSIVPTVPPLLGIAKINLAHLKNSCAFEDYLRSCGTGTVIINGENFDYEKFREQNPEGVYLGNGGGLFLPGGDAKLLQMEEQQVLMNAMKQKQDQILMAGGQFVTENQVAATATEIKVKFGAKICRLDIFVSNLEDGMLQQLRYLAMLHGADPDKCEFRLNHEYFPEETNPQLMAQDLLDMEAGITSRKQVRDNRRKQGRIAEDIKDEELDAEIAKEMHEQGQLEPPNAAIDFEE